MTRTISISQPYLIRELLERFGLSAAMLRDAPIAEGMIPTKDTLLEPLSADQFAEHPAVVGCLIYVANMTRPDVAFTVTALARFISCPRGSSTVVSPIRCATLPLRATTSWSSMCQRCRQPSR